MLPFLTLLTVVPHADASSNIEFRVNGPVLIYVDGQQATMTGKMRQQVVGLEPGTHEVRVTGVFGKTLFEAEIDVPDNTMTWAEWSRGELRVIRTEWLEAVEEAAPVEEAPAEELPLAEDVEEQTEPVQAPVAVEEVPAPPPEVASAPAVEAAPPAPAEPTASNGNNGGGGIVGRWWVVRLARRLALPVPRRPRPLRRRPLQVR